MITEIVYYLDKKTNIRDEKADVYNIACFTVSISSSLSRLVDILLRFFGGLVVGRLNLYISILLARRFTDQQIDNMEKIQKRK